MWAACGLTLLGWGLGYRHTTRAYFKQPVAQWYAVWLIGFLTLVLLGVALYPMLMSR
jgi:hypothetical protein